MKEINENRHILQFYILYIYISYTKSNKNKQNKIKAADWSYWKHPRQQGLEEPSFQNKRKGTEMSLDLSVFVSTYLLSLNLLRMTDQDKSSSLELSVTSQGCRDRNYISRLHRRPCLKGPRSQRDKGLQNFALFSPQAICQCLIQWERD